MKVTLVMFKDGERRDFPLSAAHTVIGRKSDCTLRIPTGDVSRRHCEVTILDDEVTVRDLGSANGTYVNGRRIAESVLNAGDELMVGPVRFVVQVNGQPAQIAPPTTTPAAAKAEGAAAAAEDEELFVLDEADLLEEEDDALTTLDPLGEENDDKPSNKRK